MKTGRKAPISLEKRYMTVITLYGENPFEIKGNYPLSFQEEKCIIFVNFNKNNMGD